MSTNHLRDLTNAWQTILMFGLLGLVLSLVISFVQPLRYGSTARLLILQNIGSQVDAYTASRSEERIAENLSTIIYTSTFFDQVMETGFDIDENFFPTDGVKRRRAWQKTVEATVSRGSGLLTISAYHQDIKQAEQIIRAVAFVLTNRVSEFTSGGSVQVRLIDAPLNSRWPVKPNILANIFSGFFLAGFVGVGYVLLQSERLRKRHQFVHE
jgi:capsular polysaccharide biosynthesis protein